MSTQRRCDIFKATDGQWYMTLGNFEHAEELRDCTTYGPFTGEQAAIEELDNHSNPGGWNTDDSGTAPAPKNAQRPSGSSFNDYRTTRRPRPYRYR